MSFKLIHFNLTFSHTKKWTILDAYAIWMDSINLNKCLIHECFECGFVVWFGCGIQIVSFAYDKNIPISFYRKVVLLSYFDTKWAIKIQMAVKNDNYS